MAGTLTKQQQFSDAVMAYMSELKGGNLKKFCDTRIAKGGESYTFNRMTASSATDNVESMYGAGKNTGDGGDMKEFKATIGIIASQQKISKMDMDKTTVDIKNEYVKSLSHAVERKEDAKIIDAIVAKTPQASPVEGTNINKAVIANYTDEANVKKLIKIINKTKALAKHTASGNYKGVALVMSSEDWADLSSTDYVLNNNYAATFGGSTTGEPDNFFGAEVVIIDGHTNVGGVNHKAYVIPSNCVCFAEWEGSITGDAVYVPTDGMKWHLQATKSVGVVVAQTAVITQIANA